MVRMRKDTIKWTEEMNNLLLERCKKKALTISRSDQAPRKENGRRKGFMYIMKLSDNSEYANFQLRSQNLRDQASRLEKTLGNATELIVNKWGVGNIERRQQEQRLMESENSDLMG